MAAAEQPKLTRQNATCERHFTIDLVRYCTYNAHGMTRVGPEAQEWYIDINEAIQSYAVWYCQNGNSLCNADLPDCCGFRAQLITKTYD